MGTFHSELQLLQPKQKIMFYWHMEVWAELFSWSWLHKHRSHYKRLCWLLTGLSSFPELLHKGRGFPFSWSVGWSKRRPRCCKGSELMSLRDGRAASRWDPSMYLSTWNDDWLPVGWRNTNRLQLDRKIFTLCVWLPPTAGNLTPLQGQRITWAYVEFCVHLVPYFPRKKQKFLKVYNSEIMLFYKRNRGSFLVLQEKRSHGCQILYRSKICAHNEWLS